MKILVLVSNIFDIGTPLVAYILDQGQGGFAKILIHKFMNEIAFFLLRDSVSKFFQFFPLFFVIARNFHVLVLPLSDQYFCSLSYFFPIFILFCPLLRF